MIREAPAARGAHWGMNMDRNETIKTIKEALRRRSGKAWSVTGGRGTAYCWITIDVPPAQRTFTYVPKPHNTAMLLGVENWDEIDSGQPGGHMGPTARAELCKLLGLESVHQQGVSIAASHDHYEEYIARAQGQEPTKIAKQYWD